jgi:drug/metabolite transporter (DMT)-like permease
MKPKLDLKLLFALLAVAIVWGTTYLAIRIAVETIPPWFVTGIRQSIAATILLIVLGVNRKLKWIGWVNFRQQFTLALLMIVLANGFTTYAEKTIPSGLTSVLNAVSPLMVFVGSVIFGLQKPSFKGFFGVIIGLLGVVFIFRNGLNELLNPSYLTGIFFLTIAILGWTSGTLYTKMLSHKADDIFLNLCYQFTIAALIQLGLAFIFSAQTNVQTWSLRSLAAVLYLAIFGSLVGYFSYLYAIKKVNVTKVAMLSYFNTVIAVFLGWLVLNETITFDLLIATAMIIIGVFITNYKGKVVNT